MRTKIMTKVALSSFAVLFITGGVLITTANAQGHRHGRRIVIVPTPHPFWFRRFDRFNRFDRWDEGRRAYYRANQREKGFEEGLEQGENDAEKGRRFDPRGQKEYLNSDSHTFRRAFVRGYYLGYRNEIRDERDDQ